MGMNPIVDQWVGYEFMEVSNLIHPCRALHVAAVADR